MNPAELKDELAEAVRDQVTRFQLSRLAKAEAVAEVLEDLLSNFNVPELGDTVRSSELREQAKLQRDVKAFIDRLNALKTELNKVHDFVRISVIPEAMEAGDIQSMTYADLGFRLGTTADIHASIRAGMKEQAFDWLEDNGHGDLVVPGVNSSSLKALAKRRVRDGEDMPEELFSISPFVRATISKTAAK